MPIVPIPAAARYSSSGEPRPAGADDEDSRGLQFGLTDPADLGQQDVTGVALQFVVGEIEVHAGKMAPAGRAIKAAGATAAGSAHEHVKHERREADQVADGQDDPDPLAMARRQEAQTDEYGGRHADDELGDLDLLRG